MSRAQLFGNFKPLSAGAACECNDEALGCPDAYLDRADWFEEMAKTHEQRQCPKHGLWTVWVLKKRR